jgi:gas vesicle protein
MDQGVAALVGAAIGGATATLAALIAGRASRQQARAQHHLWRSQTRREVYTAYAAALDAALEAIDPVRKQATKLLVAHLRPPGAVQSVALELAGEARSEERRKARELVDALRPFSAQAAVEGPEPVRAAVRRLTRDVGSYLASCTATVESATAFADEALRSLAQETMNEGQQAAKLSREAFFQEVTHALNSEPLS